MSTLAVVATFFRRPLLVPRIAEALRTQTRPADEVWLMYEDPDDCLPLAMAWDEGHALAGGLLRYLPDEGTLPVSVGINMALDRSDADYVTYLTDDSLPLPEKFEQMAGALDANPDWFAVYCSQDYGHASGHEDWLAGGQRSGIRTADNPEPRPFCRVDHTQVMHRRTDVRWPLSPGAIRYSDGVFFRDLADKHGPFMPVPGVLDWTRQMPDGISSR
jgi:hypothetical protein